MRIVHRHFGENFMRIPGSLQVLEFAILLITVPMTSHALPMPSGHHGGLVTQCTDPRFFDESPGHDAKVERLERFTFTASDNTDPTSIEVLVNLRPAEVSITPQRSGRLAVEAKLAEPVTQGRAWIKVTGMSDDGCQQLHTWNVYAGH